MIPEGESGLAFAEGNPLLDPQGKAALRVLHLEDNDIDAKIFEAACARCSRTLSVVRVSSLAEFRQSLDEVKPHLICADHLLPDGSALEAISLSSKHYPESPFIVITGAGEEDVAVDYLKAGAADYLSKRKLDLFPTALDVVLQTYKTRALHLWSEMERQRLTEELTALLRKVEEERDEEKRSLSRDIHDQLGQELTALKLGLFWIKNQLQNVPVEGSPSPLMEKMDQLIGLNTSIIEEVRNIAHALRPVVLDQVGLAAGLETLVQDFNRRDNTFCGLYMGELPDLSESLRTDIFRMVQEALTNISKHAEANLAYIQLKHIGQDLLLEIGDDGLGSQDKPDSKRKGLGMVGMRERARNHNADFSVNTKKGMGTSIVIRFPNVTSS
ncbi:MAG: response regulator [Flavobacteriales bacterium]|nr:response regulator [Flavobacteriales bacterium]